MRPQLRPFLLLRCLHSLIQSPSTQLHPYLKLQRRRALRKKQPQFKPPRQGLPSGASSCRRLAHALSTLLPPPPRESHSADALSLNARVHNPLAHPAHVPHPWRRVPAVPCTRHAPSPAGPEAQAALPDVPDSLQAALGRPSAHALALEPVPALQAVHLA